MESKNWEEVIEKYENLVAENPHSAENHKELGNAFHRTGQYDLALEEYRTCLHIDGEYFPAHYNMGNTYFKLGHYQQAIICWQKALLANPKLEQAIYNIGFSYYRMGTEEADREKSRRLLDNAVLEFQKAIAISPKNTDTHLHLGLTWFELGRFDEAVREFKTVLELDPGDRYAHYNLGNVYYEAGHRDPRHYERALDEYRKSIQKNPEDIKSRNNIADCLLRLGRHADALAQIDGVLEDNPDYIPARCTRGEVFAATGQLHDAVREFRLVLQLDPEEHKVLHRYVSRQLLELYQALVSREGADANVYHALGRTYREVGVSYGDRTYILKARDVIREAITRFGSRLDLHLLLGETYMLLANYDYALMEAERCLNIDPDSVPAHALLSEIYYHNGDRDLAVAEIQTVRKLLEMGSTPDIGPAPAKSKKANGEDPSPKKKKTKRGS